MTVKSVRELIDKPLLVCARFGSFCTPCSAQRARKTHADLKAVRRSYAAPMRLTSNDMARLKALHEVVALYVQVCECMHAHCTSHACTR